MLGSVSVAGVSGNMWSVAGGNYKIPENLLKTSGANLLQEIVTRIKKLPSGEIQIDTLKKSNDTQENGKIYDVVVLAAPQYPNTKYKINFDNFDNNINFNGQYHRTVCTLIEGNLREDYFQNKNSIVDEILTIKEGLLFNSLGRITPVEPINEESKKVWKIFTQKKLKDKEISDLFYNISNTYVKDWLAYPHYTSKTSPGNSTFILDSNLYYINAIEWAASAMEMSAIGAKNVALLIYNKFINNDNKLSLDSEFTTDDTSSKFFTEEL